MYSLVLLITSLLVVAICIRWYAARIPRVRRTTKSREACWFYQDGEAKEGPVLAEEIAIRIAQGELDRQVHLWSSHLKTWTPASMVPEITTRIPRDAYSKEYSNCLSGNQNSKECSRSEFESALNFLAKDLGYSTEEVSQRMILEDNTGRSCVTILARRLQVDVICIRNLL